MHPRILSPFLCALAAPALTAAVVGTNPPALPLTVERINALPAADQPAWHQYFARSRAQWAMDQAFFADELKRHNLTTTTSPREGRGGLGFNRPAEWFASDEARKLADNVISFQTPAGGWSKNMNYADHARQPGERFAPGNAASPLSAAASAKAPGGNNDAPHDPSWHYVGTFDNNATISQLRFLARIATANPGDRGAACRASVLRGLEYMLAAQYPHGGFPQVWPLEGGYHDSITYNDNAMVNVLELLRDMARGQGDFAFIPADARTRAGAAVDRGLSCILASQIIENGRRTGWCQQHDMLTLAPTSARNYEMPSISGGESAALTGYLMAIEKPSAEVIAAVHAAAAWFEKTRITGFAYRNVPGAGRSLVADPTAGPLWARYYEIGSDRPLFGDRDKSIHDKVDEISAERRNGYQWFGNGPARTLEVYATWAKAHPAK